MRKEMDRGVDFEEELALQNANRVSEGRVVHCVQVRLVHKDELKRLLVSAAEEGS